MSWVLPSLIEMTTPGQRAAIYKPIFRSWGILRQYGLMPIGIDPATGLGNSQLWMIDDPIFNACAVAHDWAYQNLWKPGESTKPFDDNLAECMDHQVARYKAGELDNFGKILFKGYTSITLSYNPIYEHTLFPCPKCKTIHHEDEKCFPSSPWPDEREK